MSFKPNGTPPSNAPVPARLPALSKARAAASAAGPARKAQARTTGSRSAIRSRQLAATSSAVSIPPSIRRTISVAGKRWGSSFGIGVKSPQRLGHR